MRIQKWTAYYEQLNVRSRWYSSQLWHVPFAYLAVAGFGPGGPSACGGFPLQSKCRVSPSHATHLARAQSEHRPTSS